jgi:hypothetical protein
MENSVFMNHMCFWLESLHVCGFFTKLFDETETNWVEIYSFLEFLFWGTSAHAPNVLIILLKDYQIYASTPRKIINLRWVAT